MNKNDLMKHVGNNVLITFRNGEAQVGKLTVSPTGIFTCGKFGGQFKPVSVATVSGSGIKPALLAKDLKAAASVAGVPKSDTGYKPAKRASKTPAKKTASSVKHYTASTTKRKVTIEATNLREAKAQVLMVFPPVRSNWTVQWTKSAAGSDVLNYFNSRGTRQPMTVTLRRGTKADAITSDSKPAAKKAAVSPKVKTAGMVAARKSSGNVPATKPVGKRAASKPAKAAKPQRVIKVDKKTGRKTVLIVK